MDNNDEIIIPKKNSKTPSTSNAPEEKKSTNRPLMIALVCVCVFVVVLIIAIAILASNKTGTSGENEEDTTSEDTSEDVKVETIYTTPDDSEDPEADYDNFLNEQKAKAETPEEIFDAEITIIANNIANEKYDDSLTRLDAISRDNLSADQLFRLYNVYTRLFEGTGDTARYDEYVLLRDEQRDILIGEE